jgi:hypothetical protein
LATALAPVALVVVLLHRIGTRFGPLAIALLCGVAVLGGVRAALTYTRLRARLRRFKIDVEPERLEVHTASASISVPQRAVARVVEISGPLGGLTIRLSPPSGEIESFDVPRGGERFGDVRAQIEAWRSIERTPRRSVALRIAIGGVVVAAIFFLPFLLDDLASRSKAFAAIAVLGVWVALRTRIWRR